MPSDFSLNENLILAMMQRLETQLGPMIQQINAERGNNTTPPYYMDLPQQILDAPPVAAQLNGGFPIVALADGNTFFQDDVGWGATGVHDLLVLAYVNDPDPRALAWKLRRYAQALVTVALYGRNVDFGAWGTTLVRIIPSRRVSRQDPNGKVTFMSWTAVHIQAKDEQDTP